MPDIRPRPQTPQPPNPSNSATKSGSMWARWSRARKIRMSILAAIVIGSRVVYSAARAGTSTVTTTDSSTGSTTASRATTFTYGGVTYEATITNPTLNGSTLQSATEVDFTYSVLIKSRPAGLQGNTAMFQANPAVPKSETTECGAEPTPPPANSMAGIGDYFMPVAVKSGWCELLYGKDNEVNSQVFAPADPSSSGYSYYQPGTLQVQNLKAPLNRTKVGLVISPAGEGNSQEWFVPYQGN